jgi:hypothetical protein
MRLKLFIASVAVIGLTTFTGSKVLAGTESVSTSSHHPVAEADFDRFELSLGYNYLHLGDADPEPEHLHGVDVSGFVNLNRFLALGGEFMADFGSESRDFFGGSVDFDSQRYLYVFGPRVTLFRSPQVRVFVQALAGGVHAHAEASAGSLSRSISEDGFAAAGGFGVDWRFSEHLSWRIIQADYVPTELDGDWQHNFRASTGIVWSFGH